jgi:N-dimethylarginine dimethylaminohydrolase
MSGADYFDDGAAINPFMDAAVPIDRQKAAREHAVIGEALRQAGINIETAPPPVDCQDGVYTANWALVRGNTAILANLPNARQAETPYAERVLHGLGKTVLRLPATVRFSGQGDALACGDYLFTGSGYRTDQAAHELIGEILGYHVISLETIPALDKRGQPVTNRYSGWPDSFFYDIDLALAVLRHPDATGSGSKGLIAWCPEAFTPASRAKINALTVVEKIEVSLEEARHAYACNLVSTGTKVVMSAHAPKLQAAIEARGLETITPDISELAKGGGYIRCTSLTLNNP